MCPKRVDKESRKKEILHAAMHEMARKGVNVIKIGQIAAAAGIGKGTIYEYFSSKEEVFGAAMAEFLGMIEDIQARRLFRAVTPQEKIKAIIDSWVEATDTLPHDHMKLLLDLWAEGIRQSNPDLKEIFDMKKLYYEYREIVSAIIRDGINAGVFRDVAVEVVSGIFLASVDGLIIQWLLDRDSMDIGETAGALYDTFMQGIAVK